MDGMSIHTLERTLGEHPFFKELSASHLALLTSCATNVVFKAGSFIMREGAPADRFFVLRHGSVGLEIAVPAGGAVTIETLKEGDVLGWSWLFPPYKAHFDARALSQVRALSLDGACLRERCEADSTLGYEFVRRFAGMAVTRLESARLQFLDLYGQRR
jgi:CRP-like cAMP-binding protein